MLKNGRKFDSPHTVFPSPFPAHNSHCCSRKKAGIICFIHIYIVSLPEKTSTMKKLMTFLVTLLGLNVNSACSQQSFKDADVEEFFRLAETASDVQLLDVRTAEEYAESHIAGAQNIDINKETFLETVLKQLDKQRPVAVYCRSGKRSVKAANILTANGFEVINLKGGILAWQSKGKPVTTDTHERDLFTTKSGKTVQLYALMHASIRMVYDGKEIEIDPVGQLGNRTTDYASLPKADFIFVTHEHPDHFSPETIALLSAGNTRIITNQRCADRLERGTVMANGDRLDLSEDISIEAVPAYNTTPDHLQFHPKGRDNGFVVSLDGLRIYIAGDTEDIPEMAEIQDIDIAFLPCNQPYTMTPDQLLRAARMVKPRVLFPYHYGQTNVSEVPSQLKNDSIEVRLRHYE